MNINNNFKFLHCYCYILCTLYLTSCCKIDPTPEVKGNSIECNNLKLGFVTSDYSSIKPIIDTLCKKYLPSPILSDPLGHEKNTELLVTEINETCLELKVALKCYACLESIPLQSSFVVQMDSNGVQIIRQFTIFVPEGEVMYFNN